MATRLLSGGGRGAVQYTMCGEFQYAMNCHCSQCRRATAHIHVGSKAPWFTITNNLPQHEEL